MKNELVEFVKEVINEARPSELISQTSQKVRDKSKSRDASLSRVDRTNNVWNYTVSGEGESYIVKIKVLDSSKKTLEDSDILITCNCPFFRWQGPEHWARVGGYLYQKPAGTATKPVIMDPAGVHRICKHAVSALEKAKNILL